MTRFLLGWLCASLLPSMPSGASEWAGEPAAVIVSMPETIDLSYASPATWYSLPASPFLHEKPPLPLLDPGEIDLRGQPTRLALHPD